MLKATAKGVWGSPPEFQTGEGVANISLLPPSECSKYAPVYVDIVAGLKQSVPCNHTKQATTNRGLEKLSTMYR